ncbi:MAG: hypothetical protein R3C68_01040 [Myxococcota bacterium]
MRTSNNFRGLEQLLIGRSTPVPHVCRALDVLDNTQIINGYGPTECTTFTATYAIPRQFDPSSG